MTFIKDAFEFLFRKSDEMAAVLNEDKKVHVISELPTDGRTIQYLHKGEVKEYAVPPALRNHRVDTVKDVIRAALRWGRNGVVFVNESAVVLVLDDSDRRQYVSLSLETTELFEKVTQLAKNPSLSQPAFLGLLRREFRNSPDQPAMLAAVRKIKFKMHTSGFSDIQHGNESLGKTIENEITGAEGIAESMVVPVRVFQNAGEDTASPETVIGFDLELDASRQQFILRPMPGEVETAMQLAMSSIRDRLESDLDIPVFFGTP